jgi:hypothetical protein
MPGAIKEGIAQFGVALFEPFSMAPGPGGLWRKTASAAGPRGYRRTEGSDAWLLDCPALGAAELCTFVQPPLGLVDVPLGWAGTHGVLHLWLGIDDVLEAYCARNDDRCH